MLKKNTSSVRTRSARSKCSIPCDCVTALPFHLRDPLCSHLRCPLSYMYLCFNRAIPCDCVTTLLHLRDPLCSHLRYPLSYPDSGVLRLDPSQDLVAPRVSDSCHDPQRLNCDDDVALCVLFAANGNLERRVVSNVKMR
jgi:hypothetical protein